MANIERTVEIEAPVTAAYEAWMRFEAFPEFMDGVQRVEHLGDGAMRWTGDLGFGRETWEVHVLEAIPDLLVSWESTSRRRTAGTASFSSEQGHTHLKLTLSYDPEGVPANAGADHREVMAARLDRELRQFKEQVESSQPRPAGAAQT